MCQRGEIENVLILQYVVVACLVFSDCSTKESPERSDFMGRIQ